MSWHGFKFEATSPCLAPIDGIPHPDQYKDTVEQATNGAQRGLYLHVLRMYEDILIARENYKSSKDAEVKAIQS